MKMYQTSDGWRSEFRRVDGGRRTVRGKTRAEVEERMAVLMEQDAQEASLPSYDGNLATLWNAVKSHVNAENLTDSDVVEAEFDFGNLPVGMLLMSDWHVGSRWTNYNQLEADVNHVAAFRKANPGALRLAHLGDLADNYFASGKHPSGMHETVVARTDKQRELALWLAKQAGQWDVMLYGCHLAWNLTQVGEDVLAPIARELGAVNGGYGCAMRIGVGTQVYNHLIRHKGPAGPTGGHNRLDNDYGPYGERADVISTSHQHVCYMEEKPKAGRHVVYTRSGGYKGGDCFARAGAFTATKEADCGVPLVIYMPDEHRVIPFGGHAWREGLQMLAMLRKQYKRKGF